MPGSPFRLWDALLDTLLGVVPSTVLLSEMETGSPVCLAEA